MPKSKALVPQEDVITDPEIRAVIQRLAAGEEDPQDTLRLLVDIILEKRRNISLDEAKQALEKVLDNYENKLGVGLVAVARAKMDRVVRIARFLDCVESELFKEERVKVASTNELLGMIETGQKVGKQDLEFIERILELRMKGELRAAELAVLQRDITSTPGTIEVGGKTVIVSPESRDRIRKILDRLMLDGTSVRHVTGK